MPTAGVLPGRELTGEERQQAILDLPLSPIGFLARLGGKVPRWLAKLLGGRAAAQRAIASGTAADEAAAELARRTRLAQEAAAFRAAERQLADVEAAARKARRTDVFLRPGTPIQRAALGAGVAGVTGLGAGPTVLELLRPGAAPPLPPVTDVPDVRAPDGLPEEPDLSPEPFPMIPSPPVLPLLVAPLAAAPEAPPLVRVSRVSPRELAAQRRATRAAQREQREAAMWAELGAIARQGIASTGDVLATAMSTKWGAATLGVPISLLVLAAILTPDQRAQQAARIISTAPTGWAPEETGDRTDAPKPPAPVVSVSGLDGGRIGGQPVTSGERSRYLALTPEQRAVVDDYLRRGLPDPYGVAR